MNQDIEQCLHILKSGGIILYPTDTIWGLGADGANAEAVAKVMALKNRPAEKSMILLFASWEQVAEHFGDVNELKNLAKDYQDKPTTFVFYPEANPYPYLASGDSSIAVRITTEEFSKNLCLKLNSPLISTSANLAGQPSATSFKEIDQTIKQGVDYIVNYRQNENKPAVASRIIKLTPEGEKIILRN